MGWPKNLFSLSVRWYGKNLNNFFGQANINKVPSVQFSCSIVSDSVTPWRGASLSITNSQSLLKLLSSESVRPSNHLILYRSLLLWPSIFPSIKVFSNESVLRIRWPKYWNFSFSISPSDAIVIIVWGRNFFIWGSDYCILLHSNIIVCSEQIPVFPTRRKIDFSGFYLFFSERCDTIKNWSNLKHWHLPGTGTVLGLKQFLKANFHLSSNRVSQGRDFAFSTLCPQWQHVGIRSSVIIYWMNIFYITEEVKQKRKHIYNFYLCLK